MAYRQGIDYSVRTKEIFECNLCTTDSYDEFESLLAHMVKMHPQQASQTAEDQSKYKVEKKNGKAVISLKEKHEFEDQVNWKGGYPIAHIEDYDDLTEEENDNGEDDDNGED